MADCPYSEMEWYCCLAEGHDGPHQSANFGTDLIPSNQELVAGDEIVDGELVIEYPGFEVKTWIDHPRATKNISVTVTDEWVARVPREWIDELGAIRDRLFALASHRPPGI